MERGWVGINSAGAGCWVVAIQSGSTQTGDPKHSWLNSAWSAGLSEQPIILSSSSGMKDNGVVAYPDHGRLCWDSTHGPLSFFNGLALKHGCWSQNEELRRSHARLGVGRGWELRRLDGKEFQTDTRLYNICIYNATTILGSFISHRICYGLGQTFS